MRTMPIVYIYLGGVIALLCESLVQWLHPEDCPTRESPSEALIAACIWPIMAVLSIIELIRKSV